MPNFKCIDPKVCKVSSHRNSDNCKALHGIRAVGMPRVRFDQIQDPQSSSRESDMSRIPSNVMDSVDVVMEIVEDGVEVDGERLSLEDLGDRDMVDGRSKGISEAVVNGDATGRIGMTEAVFGDKSSYWANVVKDDHDFYVIDLASAQYDPSKKFPKVMPLDEWRSQLVNIEASDPENGTVTNVHLDEYAEHHQAS